MLRYNQPHKKGVIFIRRKTKLTLALLIIGLICLCAVYAHMNKITVTTTMVDSITEYDATAGVISAVKVPKVTVPTVKEVEVDLTKEEEPNWVEMDVPSNNSFKSYMDCSTITDETSPQYQLKFDYLSSASGIMVVDDDCYVIALGTYYTTEIGTRVDLVMENGSIVRCVVGDIKANEHTDSANQQHLYDNSVVEFIVATDNLSDEVRTRGDVSYADPRLEGEIKAIRVYLEN